MENLEKQQHSRLSERIYIENFYLGTKSNVCFLLLRVMNNELGERLILCVLLFKRMIKRKFPMFFCLILEAKTKHMNLRKILIPAFLFAAFTQVNAQQRTCDMQVTLLEPAPSAVINAFAQYNLRVNIVNNGPDTLFTGDTLYYNKPTQPLFTYNPYILTQPIVPNGSVNLTLETLNNVNTNQQDETMDYYVYVVSKPLNNGAFIDTTNDANNYDANANVTFKAGQPTAINDLEKSKNTLRLFPNPAGSQISFNIDASNTALAAIISDISGRKVMSSTFNQKTKTEHQLDVSGLLPGMYIVQLQTDKGMAIGKFIKK
jgi:hypothetical protein